TRSCWRSWPRTGTSTGPPPSASRCSGCASSRKPRAAAARPGAEAVPGTASAAVAVILLLRSVLAVAAAGAGLVALALAGRALAPRPRRPPGGTPRLAWALAWLALACVAAGVAAAWLAPAAPRSHALAFLGVLLAVLAAGLWQSGGWPAWFMAGVLLAPLLAAAVVLARR